MTHGEHYGDWKHVFKVAGVPHGRHVGTSARRHAQYPFSGFYVREDGKVGHAEKATTLDAARARAGRPKAALEIRVVHTEVLNYCRAELLDENYFHAVFEATKGVAERIRLLSGLNGDRADLVNKAFAGQQPVLALGPLTTESEKSKQKGFANLLIGLFGAEGCGCFGRKRPLASSVFARGSALR